MYFKILSAANFRLHLKGNLKKTFCGYSWEVTSTGPGGFMVCVCIIWPYHPKALPKVVLEKRGIKSATPGLQGIALIHYTTAPSSDNSICCIYLLKLFIICRFWGKQWGPRSDCSHRSSLIWVDIVYIRFLKHYSRQQNRQLSCDWYFKSFNSLFLHRSIGNASGERISVGLYHWEKKDGRPC